jgi:curved DNA-binding protein CbpA
MKTEKRDLYEVLGVSRDVTPEELKVAYRKKAKKHHPDIGGDVGTMQAITLAYDVLGDPDKRARYDQTGEADEKDSEGAFRSMFLDILDKAAREFGPDKLKLGFEKVAKSVLKAMESQEAKTRKDLAGCKKSMARVGPSQDFGTIVLRNILEEHSRDCEKVLARIAEQKEVLAKVREAGSIMDYQDEEDEDDRPKVRASYYTNASYSTL